VTFQKGKNSSKITKTLPPQLGRVPGLPRIANHTCTGGCTLPHAYMHHVMQQSLNTITTHRTTNKEEFGTASGRHAMDYKSENQCFTDSLSRIQLLASLPS
jgi:hypothetical protein